MAFAYCERSNGLLIRCKSGGRRGAHSQSLPKCEGSARPVPLGFAFPFGTGEMLTDCARSASGLRWLVLMQQVMGQFPFAWPSPGERKGKGAPEFSVPLFPWTLALQVARVSAAALQNFVLFSIDAEKVSDVIKGSAFVFANTVLSAAQLLQFLNSKRLAEILSELKSEDHVGRKNWRKLPFYDIVGHYAFVAVYVLGIAASALHIRWNDMHHILMVSNRALLIAFALVFSLLYREMLLTLSNKLERLTRESVTQAGLTRSREPARNVEAVSPPGDSEDEPRRALLLHRLERHFREVGVPSAEYLVAFATKAISVECLYSYLHLPTCTHKKHTCLDISISAVSTFQCSPIISRTPFKLIASLTSKIYIFLPLVSL